MSSHFFFCVSGARSSGGAVGWRRPAGRERRRRQGEEGRVRSCTRLQRNNRSLTTTILLLLFISGEKYLQQHVQEATETSGGRGGVTGVLTCGRDVFTANAWCCFLFGFQEPEEKPDVWSSGSCENLSDNVPKVLMPRRHT